MNAARKSATEVTESLSVRIMGDTGPDVALLHGWGLGSGIWEPMTEVLASRCRVHVIDLPGYGASKTVARGHHHADNYLSLLAEMVVRCLPRGVTLAGWSLGGLIALATLAKNSKHVGKLALIGSTPSFLERPDWPHGVPANMLDLFESALNLTPGLLLKRFNAQINQGDKDAKALTKLTEKLTHQDTPDVEALKGGLKLLRNMDLRPILPKIHHPALIIHGEHDPLMKLAGAQAMRGMFPKARLEVFQGASHIPFLSQPEHFALTLADFAGSAA